MSMFVMMHTLSLSHTSSRVDGTGSVPPLQPGTWFGAEANPRCELRSTEELLLAAPKAVLVELDTSCVARSATKWHVARWSCMCTWTVPLMLECSSVLRRLI